MWVAKIRTGPHPNRTPEHTQAHTHTDRAPNRRTGHPVTSPRHTGKTEAASERGDPLTTRRRSGPTNEHTPPARKRGRALSKSPRRQATRATDPSPKQKPASISMTSLPIFATKRRICSDKEPKNTTKDQQCAHDESERDQDLAEVYFPVFEASTVWFANYGMKQLQVRGIEKSPSKCKR